MFQGVLQGAGLKIIIGIVPHINVSSYLGG